VAPGNSDLIDKVEVDLLPSTLARPRILSIHRFPFWRRSASFSRAVPLRLCWARRLESPASWSATSGRSSSAAPAAATVPQVVGLSYFMIVPLATPGLPRILWTQFRNSPTWLTARRNPLRRNSPFASSCLRFTQGASSVTKDTRLHRINALEQCPVAERWLET